MAIRCSRFVFASAPKTGCHLMRGIMEQVGGCRWEGNQHHPESSDALPVLSFVRDPVDWIRSYFQNVHAPIGHAPVDRFCEFGSHERRHDPMSLYHLECFVKGYLASTRPGEIGRMMRSYPADYRFRVEDCPRAVCEHLGLELQWYPDRQETRSKISVPHALRCRIREHEKELIEQWGY